MAETTKLVASIEEYTLGSGDLFIKEYTAGSSVNESTKKRTIKSGGLAHAANKSYAMAFSYRGDGKKGLTVLIVGKNSAGFTVTFGTDNATVIDAEFKAQALDNDGTLVVIEETVPASVSSS